MSRGGSCHGLCKYSAVFCHNFPQSLVDVENMCVCIMNLMNKMEQCNVNLTHTCDGLTDVIGQDRI